MKTLKSFSLIILLAFPAVIFAQKSKKNLKINNAKENTEMVVYNENTPHFMQFGIMSRSHEEFRKKYGIAVVYQNCVISQFLSQKAKENNKLVAKVLTEKFGDSWRKDLGFIPYGL